MNSPKLILPVPVKLDPKRVVKDVFGRPVGVWTGSVVPSTSKGK